MNAAALYAGMTAVTLGRNDVMWPDGWASKALQLRGRIGLALFRRIPLRLG
jgi:hypothetical protein